MNDRFLIQVGSLRIIDEEISMYFFEINFSNENYFVGKSERKVRSLADQRHTHAAVCAISLGHEARFPFGC